MPRPTYELAHCIVCGHTDTETVVEGGEMRREMEILWAYHQRRMRPDTPPSQLIDRVAFSEHPPLRLVRCRECGLVYRNPMERPRSLAAIYEEAAPSVGALRALHETQRPAMRVQARALRAVSRRGNGLEVGSYAGAFLGAARDEGLAFEGVDVNPHINDFVRSLGFTVHDGELASLEGGRTFDIVAVWNVFDQLADPRGTLAAARRVLTPGGLLAIRVPNGGFYNTWRRMLSDGGPRRVVARGVLAQNNLLTFPYRWGFTPNALVRLVGECGFEPVAVRGDTLVRTADRWTRGWARVEEILIKRLTAVPARLAHRWAPWFEVYATAKGRGSGVKG